MDKIEKAKWSFFLKIPTQRSKFNFFFMGKWVQNKFLVDLSLGTSNNFLYMKRGQKKIDDQPSQIDGTPPPQSKNNISLKLGF